MFRVMLNTFKLLLKKKSFIVMGVVAPAVIIVFFSFAFGQEMDYKVGIIDNDNKYISRELIKSINEIEDIDAVGISNDSYELMLVSHQIQMVVIIDDGFSDDILNFKAGKVVIKSISNSDIKETLLSIIKAKVNNLTLIAKVSDGSIDKFIENNKAYTKHMLNYDLNEVNESRPSVKNSIGIVIMMILISGASIANFLIEDEEQDTKNRVLASGIRPYKYYIALLVVFYFMSSMSSIIYYVSCRILNLDFGMENTYNFLVVMLLINLIAISLNLFIVSFTRNRYIAATINILVVIPTCMISGVFWDFDIMPEYLKKIGSFMPQRLVYEGIEKLQVYESISYIYDYIFYMIVISLILFSLSLFMFRIKRD